MTTDEDIKELLILNNEVLNKILEELQIKNCNQSAIFKADAIPPEIAEKAKVVKQFGDKVRVRWVE